MPLRWALVGSTRVTAADPDGPGRTQRRGHGGARTARTRAIADEVRRTSTKGPGGGPLSSQRAARFGPGTSDRRKAESALPLTVGMLRSSSRSCVLARCRSCAVRWKAVCPWGGSEEAPAAPSPSKKPSKPLTLETRVLEDAVQGSPLQLPVQRYDEERQTVGVPETDVASALPSDLPIKPLEHTYQLRARDDRQALAHVGSGKLRRRMPAPMARPSSRRPST